MEYDAIDVANFIVHTSKENKKPLTNVKLQKVLYYLQARYLVDTGEPLFHDDIQKWKHGPVVPPAYHEFKNFGSGPITSVSEKFDIKTDNDGNIKVELEKFDKEKLDEEDRNKIQETFDQLYKYGAFDLVDHTHNQSLWYDDKERVLSGEKDIPYRNRDIKEYFEKHPSEQLWKI